MSRPISDPVFDIGRDLQRAYDEGYKQGRYDEKQAAIGALKEHRALYCDNTPDTFSKLSYAEKSRVDELDTAIATLVNLPSAQPEPKQSENGSELFGNLEKLDDRTMDDSISRQAAIDSWDKLSKRGRTEFDQVLMTLPSADRPTGEWVLEEQKSQNHIENIYICSSCKNFEAWGKTELYNFCPNCGAKMKRG